jgi:hypothetical protein
MEERRLLDIQLVAQLLPRGQPDGYRAEDYSDVGLAIETSTATHSIQGAINEGGILLLGEDLKQWRGPADLA